MKLVSKIITLALICVMALLVNAARQDSKTIVPAIINIVEGSAHFVDADGNGVLNASERGRIVFKVRNDGSGDGVGCRSVVSIEGATTGITAEGKVLPAIPAGKETELEIPVTAAENADNGNLKVTFYVYEPHGLGSDKATCTITVKQKTRQVNIIPSSIKFVDDSGDGKLEGNESGYITLTVTNDFNKLAQGFKLSYRTWGATDDVEYGSDALSSLPDITAGASHEVKIPVKAGLDTKAGKLGVAFSVMDPDGLFTDELRLDIPVAAYRHPKLEVVAANLSQSIARRAPFTLELTLKNTGKGPAKDVSVDLSIPDNIFFTAGGSKQTVPALAPGESVVLKYNMIVNNDYMGNDIVAWFDLNEKFGRDDNFVPVSMAVNGKTRPKVENFCHRFVDLGLPGGVLWATCNVGAEKPEDYGLYFAWGETKGYAKGDYHNFDWNNLSYTMNSALDAAHDAATANWGDGWRMPTNREQDDLRNSTYCTWTWTTRNGVNGYEVKSKSNGNSIFLPAAGYRNDASLYYEGSYGNYWSGSLSTLSSIGAYGLSFDSSSIDWDSSYYRCDGRSVRAVRVGSK
ncbi:MAG: NEW3 domain-containing protein [Muribaculaceae bacterium]|nr:NEW3 domain-containing protein [Muribaculaceae bacterium]